MKERLRHIRKLFKLSQQEMADSLECNVRAYRSYEYETRTLPIDLLNNLNKNFNININWLLTGEGAMFLSECNNSLFRKYNYLTTKNLNTFHKRFNDIQQKNNLSDKDFSQILNTSVSRIEKLGIGKTLPTFDELNNLKENFDISIDWLLYGENNDCHTLDLSNQEQLNPNEIAVLKKIAKQFNA